MGVMCQVLVRVKGSMERFLDLFGLLQKANGYTCKITTQRALLVVHGFHLRGQKAVLLRIMHTWSK